MLGPGENGELCYRGLQIMKGYIDNPEATANTIDNDGWLHTGDLAKYDEEGSLFFVDRLKDIMRVVHDKTTTIHVLKSYI